MNTYPEPGREPYPTTPEPPRIEELPRRTLTFGEFSRSEAIDADAQHGVTEDLAGVWFAILRGDVTLVDSFYTPERWFAALAPNATAIAVVPAYRLLLTRLLLGESQKQTAIDCGLSVATLSSTLHRTLAGIGVPAQPCKAPPMLALMARAGVGAESVRARFSALRRGTSEYRIVSVARPERKLASLLTRSQYAVLCRFVEGQTYAEIALARGRSQRTVANQVAALFRRLGVSGRGELVARVTASVASGSVADDELPVASSVAAR